jgi:hypothetical protein
LAAKGEPRLTIPNKTPNAFGKCDKPLAEVQEVWYSQEVAESSNYGEMFKQLAKKFAEWLEADREF